MEGIAFLANLKHQYRASQCREHDCSPHNKKNGHYMSIQVCPISRMNINYKENGGNNSFSSNPKHQYHLSQCGEHDWSAQKKKCGAYYEYPSLSHFTYEY